MMCLWNKGCRQPLRIRAALFFLIQSLRRRCECVAVPCARNECWCTVGNCNRAIFNVVEVKVKVDVFIYAVELIDYDERVDFPTLEICRLAFTCRCVAFFIEYNQCVAVCFCSCSAAEKHIKDCLIVRIALEHCDTLRKAWLVAVDFILRGFAGNKIKSLGLRIHCKGE